VISLRGLTKQYGSTRAVDDLTFDVRPGRVTGFLGPNVAGKSTTMRLMLGLERPTAGTVTIQGRPYADIRRPLFHVGALLDAKAFHTDRTAFDWPLDTDFVSAGGWHRVDSTAPLHEANDGEHDDSGAWDDPGWDDHGGDDRADRRTVADVSTSTPRGDEK
jgi:energy-coupling factor transporter ATP-binding protein EcfA2